MASRHLTKENIESHYGDKFVKLEDGLFYIDKKGDGYRLMLKGYHKIHINKLNGYKSTTITQNGVQKTYYIHKLVAEAFVDKPNGYQEVMFIDGNPNNIHASNLRWEKDKSATLKKARAKKYDYAIECVVCGIKTLAKNGRCVTCKLQHEKELRNIQERKNWLKQIRDEVYQLRKLKLSSVQKENLDLRDKGMTYRDIAKARGVSHQAIGDSFKIMRGHNGTGRL